MRADLPSLNQAHTLTSIVPSTMVDFSLDSPNDSDARGCIRQTKRIHPVDPRGRSVPCRIRGWETRAAIAPTTPRYHPGIASHFGAAGNFGGTAWTVCFSIFQATVFIGFGPSVVFFIVYFEGGESRIRLATSSGTITTVVHTSDESRM